MCCSRSGRRNAKGFSLAELVVVIGILVLLAVLILSSLNRAREMARRTQCLSNIRQLTQAWQAYAAGNDGQLCNSVGNPEWLLFDPNSPKDAPYTPVANDPVPLIPKGQLWPYLQDRRSYVCPADPQITRNSSGTFPAVYVPGASGTSYTMNYLLGLPQRSDLPHGISRMEQIRDAPQRAVFFEGNDGWLYSGGFSCEVNSFHPSTSGSMGNIAVAFADGHAIMWELNKWGTEQRVWQPASQTDNDQFNAWIEGVYFPNQMH